MTYVIHLSSREKFTPMAEIPERWGVNLSIPVENSPEFLLKIPQPSRRGA
jgi:hypothetical protein